MNRLLQKSEVLLETAHLKPSHPLAVAVGGSAHGPHLAVILHMEPWTPAPPPGTQAACTKKYLSGAPRSSIPAGRMRQAWTLESAPTGLQPRTGYLPSEPQIPHLRNGVHVSPAPARTGSNAVVLTTQVCLLE